MTSTGPSAEAQGYLESLMHAGQDAMKQFDHALVSAAGVGTKDHRTSSGHFFPFAVDLPISNANISSSYGGSGTAAFLQNFAGGAHSDVAAGSG